ncbi:MAG: hypothetical protein ACK5LS_13875 [Propioniciclava sp.]
MVILGVGPVLLWLHQFDERLDGHVVLELIRCGSVGTFVRGELRRGASGYSRALLAVMVVCGCAAWMRFPATPGSWPLPVPPGPALAWLVIMWLLTGWSWIAIALLVRVASGSSTAAVSVVVGACAIAYVGGGGGFPMMQGSLSLLELPEQVLVQRVATQVIQLLAAVGCLALASPRFLLYQLIENGKLE